MERIAIQNILQKMGKKLNSTLTATKSKVYTETYGALAEKFHTYSKRVLELEGVVTPEQVNEPTATDLMLAKSMASDIKGGGWEGSGQGIMKFFSIMLGRNFASKEVGMECRLDLPKMCFVKRENGTIGIISENGNLITIKPDGLKKDTTFNKINTDLNLPTLEEITIFIGTVFESSSLTRNFSSAFKVATPEETLDCLALAENGIDVEKYDQYEYKSFMVDINKNITQGVSA